MVQNVACAVYCAINLICFVLLGCTEEKESTRQTPTLWPEDLENNNSGNITCVPDATTNPTVETNRAACQEKATETSHQSYMWSEAEKLCIVYDYCLSPTDSGARGNFFVDALVSGIGIGGIVLTQFSNFINPFQGLPGGIVQGGSWPSPGASPTPIGSPTSPSPPQMPSPTPMPSLAASETPDYAKDWVVLHNELRAKHGAGPLEWSDELGASATSCAQSNAKINGLPTHSTPECTSRFGGGQNIASGSTGTRAVQNWYLEIENTKGGKGSVDKEDFERRSNKLGHYTQVVWKETTRIGCGASGSYFACNYHPPGNGAWAVEENVQPLA